MYSSVIDRVVTFLFLIFWSCAVCHAQGMPTIIISPDTSPVQLEVGDILELTCTCQDMPQDPYVSLHRRKLERPGVELEPQDWNVKRINNTLIFSREVTPQDDGTSVFCEASWMSLQSVASKKITIRVGKHHAVTLPKYISKDTIDIVDRLADDDSCPPGFRSGVDKKCEDIDECAEGISICDEYQTCLNTRGGYECYCKPGYTLDPTTGVCRDINECATDQHNCISGAQQCVNTDGSFLCIRVNSCGPGYIMYPCTSQCEDIDECALGTHNCARAGSDYQCENLPGSFRCVIKQTTTSTISSEDEDDVDFGSDAGAWGAAIADIDVSKPTSH